MFEYCKGRHTDPSYEYAGTVDYGIHDLETGTLFMYSIVNMGQRMQLQVVRPFKFDEFVAMNKIKGRNLTEMYKAGIKSQGHKVKVKCAKIDKENLMPIVMKDADLLSPEDQDFLESIISEVF